MAAGSGSLQVVIKSAKTQIRDERSLRCGDLRCEGLLSVTFGPPEIRDDTYNLDELTRAHPTHLLDHQKLGCPTAPEMVTFRGKGDYCACHCTSLLAITSGPTPKTFRNASQTVPSWHSRYAPMISKNPLTLWPRRVNRFE